MRGDVYFVGYCGKIGNAQENMVTGDIRRVCYSREWRKLDIVGTAAGRFTKVCLVLKGALLGGGQL